MRLGLVVNNNGAPAVEAVRRMPVLAEEAGYESVWVTDHVVGVRSFQPVYGATWMEPMTALAWMAAATSRIRLGMGVLVVPYREFTAPLRHFFEGQGGWFVIFEGEGRVGIYHIFE